MLLFFVLFLSLIVLLTPFNKTFEPSKDSTNFIMSSISSFEITKVVVPEPCIFFEMLHQLLTLQLLILKVLKYFFANGVATFSNGPAKKF